MEESGDSGLLPSLNGPFPKKSHDPNGIPVHIPGCTAFAILELCHCVIFRPSAGKLNSTVQLMSSSNQAQPKFTGVMEWDKGGVQQSHLMKSPLHSFSHYLSTEFVANAVKLLTAYKDLSWSINLYFMVKFFPDRHCPGQQDFWQMHILADQSWMKHPESMCCCSGPVWLQTPLTAASGMTCGSLWLTDWICTFHILRESREALCHRINPCAGASLTSPAPAPSDWSPSRPRNCHTGFSSHHVLELIPWWKGQKGTSVKCSFDWHVTLCPFTHQPQLLARSGVWPLLAHGCG